MNNTEQLSLGPYWLDTNPVLFPPTELAAEDPNGLLAIGGDLSPHWLLHAYSKGIFPWFNEEDPILWWSPNPRSVLKLREFKISRSLKKRWHQKIIKGEYRITLDQAFTDVMQRCAEIKREGQDGTWITRQILDAYAHLHNTGHAHSVEVWDGEELIGGLYGLSLGKMFFGESMFAHKTDASKLALTALCLQLHKWGFEWIDTQVETPHLNSLGARLLTRSSFERGLHRFTNLHFEPQKWNFSLHWEQDFHNFQQQILA